MVMLRQSFTCSLSFATGLSEGHYKFLFNDTKELHQLHVKRSRWITKHRNTLDSWMIPNPVYVNSTKSETSSMVQTSKNIQTWYLKEKDMDEQFLNCFGYQQNYSRHYENGKLVINVDCEVNNDFSNQYNCSYHRNQMLVTIETLYDQDRNMPPDEINVNLECRIVIVDKYSYDFLFIQPLIFRYNSTYISTLSPTSYHTAGTMLSTQSINIVASPSPISNITGVIRGNTPIAITIVVVLVFIGLTTSVLFYYKKHTPKSQMKILSPSSRPNMEWADNPNYSNSFCWICSFNTTYST